MRGHFSQQSRLIWGVKTLFPLLTHLEILVKIWRKIFKYTDLKIRKTHFQEAEINPLWPQEEVDVGFGTYTESQDFKS